MPYQFLSEHIGGLKQELQSNKSTFGCTVEVDKKYQGGTNVVSPALEALAEVKGPIECALFCAGSSSCLFWMYENGDCELTSSEPDGERPQQSGVTFGSRICGRSETFSQSKKYVILQNVENVQVAY